MESSVKTFAGTLLTTALAVTWLAFPGARQADRTPAGGQPQAVEGRTNAPPAAAQPPGAYVGDETCLTCHEDQTKTYRDSAHGRAWNANSPRASHGCESCHGPGQAHVDASGDKSKIKTLKAGTPARDINAPCLECHTKGEPALWEGSPHESLNVSCATCHSIHGPKSEESQLRAARQVETCERCHRAQVQKLRRSSHMPVQEGALDCASCHNPHGSTGEKLLRAGSTVNEACQSCHAEKRGPYLWEHAPVVERCTTCHDPHGTTNDRMLVAKEPFLCHVTSAHPPTVYDAYALATSPIANRVSGRSCAACHQNVHGSNAPSGKAFLR